MSLGLGRQLRDNLGLLLAAYVPASVFIVGLAVVSRLRGIPFSNYTRDPAAIMKVSPFLGFVSNLGVVLWAASAAVCLFTAAALHKRGRVNVGFFLASGFISLVLLADDLFQVHENVSYRLGFDEAFVYAAYASLFAAYAVRFRARIWESDYLLLVFSLFFFGCSLIVDVFGTEAWPAPNLLEEGSKWLGIVGWLAYYGATSLREV
jgi:hypothetical protein